VVSACSMHGAEVRCAGEGPAQTITVWRSIHARAGEAEVTVLVSMTA